MRKVLLYPFYILLCFFLFSIFVFSITYSVILYCLGNVLFIVLCSVLCSVFG
jgi:hypothetical protein